MTTRVTKKFALDMIEKTVREFLELPQGADPNTAGRLTTQMFDWGARAGMPQRNIEVFIMATIKREQFRLTRTV